ncbi:MAG TPA: UvrD-helicase domain-containing protein [Pirellulales bacterium]|jgi:ATP-dependent exoDNAse (exonuclease V) beta subunit|nr:UvrD-helicase domain-containing protein [Pirellulales bacterium]
MKRAATNAAGTVIRASAGTGKTFQLSNWYIALVCAEVLPERILAVTFARKAAGEIVERVLWRLAEAALDARKAQELAANVGAPRNDQAAWRAHLKRLIQRLHRLRIGTLDSFFVQLAGHFSLELGLAPGWRIVDELAESRLRSEAVRVVLDRQKSTEIAALLQLLSKGEIKRSVTQQIADVVSQMYALYAETTREAWHALPRPKRVRPEEIDAAILAVEQAPLPADKRWATARNRDVQRARAGDWRDFICGGIAGKIVAGETTYYGKPIEPHLVAAYRPLIDQAESVLVGQLADQTEATWKLLDDYNAEYERLKRQQGGWRFDDVNRKLAEAFRSDGRLAEALGDVGYRLDAKLDHLLLDEFQDTSRAQWDVVRPLATEVTGRGDGSFFCVGDGKQAIYGWRGGVSEIFDTVCDQLPGLEQRSLKESFRSSQAVIDTVNHVFTRIAGNQALEDFAATVCASWRGAYESHTTARRELAGHCRLVAAPRSDDQRVATLKFAADEVRRLARQYPQQTIGVLVRRNETVARMIYLLRNHPDDPLAASEEGGNPLTDSVAVQLIMSLVKLADHPGDPVARFHVVTSPLGRAVGLNDWRDAAVAWRVGSEVREALADDGYGRTVQRWVRALAEDCNPRELSRLVQLVEQAYAYDAVATTRADDFLTHIEETKVEDPTAAPVRVMTVHQAKGLQFDIVVLPELDIQLKGQTPSVVVDRETPSGPAVRVCRYVGEDVQHFLPAKYQQMFARWPEQVVNESLCLLYVAMTRAVHALHMIIAPPTENERTFPKTFAGVLRSALVEPEKPIEPGTVLFEHGSEDWKPPEPRKHAAAGEPKVEELSVRLAEPRSGRRRHLDRQTPSGLQGGAHVDLRRRLRVDNAAALSRGSLIHACCECIEWLDDPLPNDATLAAAIAQKVPGAGDSTAEIASFRKLIDKPAIRAALSRSAYDDLSPWGLAARGPRPTVEVLRERPFVIRDGDVLLRGAIDRLVLISHGSQVVAAEVIDYKSDAITDRAAIDAAVADYQPQLEAYRRAAAQLTGLAVERITAKLLFLEAGVVRQV